MNFSTISFRQALSETERNRRHVLLGNGFSISAYDRFNYSSLKDMACTLDPSLTEIFQATGSPNFESAMMDTSDPHRRDHLRNRFIATIAHIHPTRDRALSAAQLESCAGFLYNFLRKPHSTQRGYIFTTNYDMMLYWVIMAHKGQLKSWDGFDVNGIFHHDYRFEARPSVFYLHGALHIYQLTDGRFPVRKLRGSPSAMTSLVENLRSSIGRGHIPIIVSEASHIEKAAAVLENKYLRPVFRKFREATMIKEDSLFTYGHSLNHVDAHILNLIGDGDIQNIYIGFHSSADLERAKELAAEWANTRVLRRAPPAMVKAYHVSEAPAWAARGDRDQ